MGSVTQVSEADVAQELALDRERFDCQLPEEVHALSVRVGLGLRRLLEEGRYDAHSVNFQIFDTPDRVAATIPFLESAKAMANGIGYAGEGDLLSAALVGALARAFERVTFTEVFCPDWAGNSLFLSHMGEISPAVAQGRPTLVEKPLPFAGARNPAVLTCAVRPGPATLVNLAPGPRDSFWLIVAPVQVLPEDQRLDPAMREVVRAWVRPRAGLAPFLKAYARAGGTHHNALVLGDVTPALKAFGQWLGIAVQVID